MRLRQWQIENFKSIGPQQSISLSDVTLLVGANSSGKSSILQSILLLKQTMQYGRPQAPLLLNGPLVRLGNFVDVLHAQVKRRSFALGFQLDVDESALRAVASKPTGGIFGIAPLGTECKEIHLQLESGLDRKSGDELLLQQPFLRKASLHIAHTRGPEDLKSDIDARRLRKQASPDQTFDELRAAKGQLLDVRAHRLSNDITQELQRAWPSPTIHGVTFRYFVPESLVVSYDVRLKAADEIASYLSEPFPTFTAAPSSINAPIFEAAKAGVISWLSSSDTAELKQAVYEAKDVRELSSAISSELRPSYRAEIGRFVRHGLLSSTSIEQSRKADDLRRHVFESIASAQTSPFDFTTFTPQPVARAIEDLQDYFRHGIKYLGPLREPPKPLYPLEPLPDPTDVGYRGEHTAAVYDLNKNQMITYPALKSEDERPYFKRGTLHEAATAWLSYIGIIDDLNTQDRGKFGRELQVRAHGLKKFHDLTNVGVGVSQVLPLVIMALMSRVGSLLILEQPELHLHPRVQARLADFILAVARSGRQFLIETHSEYIIYRMRRRIAEADEALSNSLSLYFVERHSGVTEVRPVHVSEYGAISEWPKDFFDTSQLEADFIIRAAATKQLAKRKGG